MEPAIVLTISVGVAIMVITGFSIYTSFGPPSKELGDPFEDHDD
jgi:PsbN protein